jgi:hypothetical protein
MRLPTSVRPGWFAANLLRLGATIFVVVLLYFLSELFADDARSWEVILLDALFGAIFFGFLIYVQALPGAIAYLFLVRRMARRVAGLRLRALAVVLSPIALLFVFFLVEQSWPLAFALPYGALISLPTHNRLPVSNA